MTASSATRRNQGTRIGFHRPSPRAQAPSRPLRPLAILRVPPDSSGTEESRFGSRISRSPFS